MVKQAQKRCGGVYSFAQYERPARPMLVAPASNKRAKRDFCCCTGTMRSSSAGGVWCKICRLTARSLCRICLALAVWILYHHWSKPTIDAYADYLASFIKLRFRSDQLPLWGVFWLCGGHAHAAKYPEIAGRVNLGEHGWFYACGRDDFCTPTKRRVFRGRARLICRAATCHHQ